MEVENEIKSGNQLNLVAVAELGKAKTAIEQFIYSCSHSLRGPLKSISGLIQLLKREDSSPEIDRPLFFASIEKTLIKMETILTDLEIFLSNSRQSIDIHSIDISKELNTAIDNYEGEIRERKIDIQVKVQDEVCLFMDSNRVNVILTHLLENAIRYADDTKSTSIVRIRSKVTKKNFRLRIHDNGIGIHSDVLPHIFELFYRGTDRSTGSGVGLYIVNEVVNKMKGNIQVRSWEGKGTLVVVTLPNLQVPGYQD